MQEPITIRAEQSSSEPRSMFQSFLLLSFFFFSPFNVFIDSPLTYVLHEGGFLQLYNLAPPHLRSILISHEFTSQLLNRRVVPGSVAAGDMAKTQTRPQATSLHLKYVVYFYINSLMESKKQVFVPIYRGPHTSEFSPDSRMLSFEGISVRFSLKSSTCMPPPFDSTRSSSKLQRDS